MKEMAAFFFILMAMTKYDVEFTEAEKLQLIKDFNAGNRIEFVQIRHEIGDSITITMDAE